MKLPKSKFCYMFGAVCLLVFADYSGMAITPALAKSPSELEQITDRVMCPTSDEVQPSIDIWIGIDISASVMPAFGWGSIISDFEALVQVAPPGALLTTTFITGNSYAHKNIVFRRQLPGLSVQPVEPENRFDRAAVRRYRDEIGQYQYSATCLENARRELISQVHALPSLVPKAPSLRTDIVGFFILASEHMSVWRGNVPGLLVCFSDSQHDASANTNQSFPGLNNSVVVLKPTWSASTSFTKAEKLRAEFFSKLKQLGVKQAFLSPLGSPWREIVEGQS